MSNIYTLSKQFCDLFDVPIGTEMLKEDIIKNLRYYIGKNNLNFTYRSLYYEYYEITIHKTPVLDSLYKEINEIINTSKSDLYFNQSYIFLDNKLIEIFSSIKDKQLDKQINFTKKLYEFDIKYELNLIQKYPNINSQIYLNKDLENFFNQFEYKMILLDKLDYYIELIPNHLFCNINDRLDDKLNDFKGKIQDDINCVLNGFQDSLKDDIYYKLESFEGKIQDDTNCVLNDFQDSLKDDIYHKFESFEGKIQDEINCVLNSENSRIENNLNEKFDTLIDNYTKCHQFIIATKEIYSFNKTKLEVLELKIQDLEKKNKELKNNISDSKLFYFSFIIFQIFVFFSLK